MTIDEKTTAFLFPGQGSQTVGMGSALAEAYPEARETFLEADAILGLPFSELMWKGPEDALNDTLNTQPALFIHSLAAFQVFQKMFPGVQPAFAAGHSLGQLSAITAAGAISFADGLRLVRRRGELMKFAGEVNPGGMAAILGMDIPTLDRVCAEASTADEIVQVANDNCPGQVVISGHKPALERAMLGAKAAGAKRAQPLAVSIAAHSPLMDTIQAEWNKAVDAAGFVDSVMPVVGNVAAAPLWKAADLRADVIGQMQSRVRWTESVQWMAEQGVTTFIELGAGTVLGGMLKRLTAGARGLPLGNPVDFSALQ
jgi:[acyl-carrier-protein] S-malonyltransferase